MRPENKFARSCRVIVFGIIALTLLAGCGNFTLPGLLDTPPDIPPGSKALAIAPSTVNAEIHVGSTVKFTASGGVGPYTWGEDTDSGLVDSTGLYTVPAAAGTYTVTVTDSTGSSKDATVNATAAIPLAISPATVDVNAGDVVTFTASGGSGTYDWSWVGGGSLTPLLDSPTSAYATPASAEAATITVTDRMTSEFKEARVTVTVPVTLSISPKRAAVLVGGSVTFNAAGSPGPYTYSILDGSGTLSGDTYTAPDFDEVAHINVAAPSAADPDTATVTVYFPLTIIPTTVSVQPGGTYRFSASGGVPFDVEPLYYYSVTAGNGTILLGSDLFTAPGAVEPDNIVTVVDSLGNSSSATFSIVAPPAGWSIDTIDAASRTGQYASLALDSAGSPRIAYYKSQAKELRLATWTGSAWAREVVDAAKSVGQYCSLALESGSAYPRISYYDARNGELQYAAWNGTVWIRQTVDSAGNVGQYTSIALEAGTNFPRIAYYSSGATSLKYAAWNGSAWLIETMDSAGDVGWYASLVLDSSGNPHIAYCEAGAVKKLKYVKKNGTWGTPEIVDSGNVGQHASLALDSSIRPRIAYFDSFNRNLKYAEKNGTWGAPETVDASGDVGRYASLKLDPSSDKPRIAYYNATAQDLKFAEK